MQAARLIVQKEGVGALWKVWFSTTMFCNQHCGLAHIEAAATINTGELGRPVDGNALWRHIIFILSTNSFAADGKTTVSVCWAWVADFCLLQRLAGTSGRDSNSSVPAWISSARFVQIARLKHRHVQFHGQLVILCSAEPRLP